MGGWQHRRAGHLGDLLERTRTRPPASCSSASRQPPSRSPAAATIGKTGPPTSQRPEPCGGTRSQKAAWNAASQSRAAWAWATVRSPPLRLGNPCVLRSLRTNRQGPAEWDPRGWRCGLLQKRQRVPPGEILTQAGSGELVGLGDHRICSRSFLPEQLRGVRLVKVSLHVVRSQLARMRFPFGSGGRHLLDNQRSSLIIFHLIYGAVSCPERGNGARACERDWT